MHDFTRKCMAAVATPDGIRVDAAQLEGLKPELAEFFGKRELFDVVVDVVRLAVAIKEEVKGDEAYQALINLLASATAALRKLGHDASRLATSLERSNSQDLRQTLGELEIEKYKQGQAPPSSRQVRAGPAAMFELLKKK